MLPKKRGIGDCLVLRLATRHSRWSVGIALPRANHIEALQASQGVARGQFASVLCFLTKRKEDLLNSCREPRKGRVVQIHSTRQIKALRLQYVSMKQRD